MIKTKILNEKNQLSKNFNDKMINHKTLSGKMVISFF